MKSQNDSKLWTPRTIEGGPSDSEVYSATSSSSTETYPRHRPRRRIVIINE